MTTVKPAVLSLAAALAALATITTPVNAALPHATDKQGPASGIRDSTLQEPNRLLAVGDDLFGFIVTERSDGTREARHYSHRSHSSHRSHYSSRY